MPQISENFGQLVDLDPVLTEIFYQKYNQMPTQMDALYNVRSSSKAKETDLLVGSFSDPPVWDGQVEYEDAPADFEVEYVHKKYVKGFQVTQDMLEDLQYDQIFQKPQDLGVAFARFREKSAMSIFPNAFTAGATAGYDAVALCSNSHPRSDEDATAVDNLLTAALGHEALENAIVQLMALKDDRGNEINLVPDLLVVGRGLRKTAHELVESPYTPESAENAVNIHEGEMRYLVTPYITSGTAWFVVDSVMSKRWLKWFDRVPVQFMAEDDFDKDMRKYKARTRFSFGWSNFRWVVGSAGTG